VKSRFLVVNVLLRIKIAKTEKLKTTISKILAQCYQLNSINLFEIFHTHYIIGQNLLNLFSISTLYSKPLIFAISQSAFLTTHLHHLSWLLKHAIRFEIRLRRLHSHWAVFSLSDFHFTLLGMIREFFKKKYI